MSEDCVSGLLRMANFMNVSLCQKTMARLAASTGASTPWSPHLAPHPCWQLDRNGGAGWARRRRGLEGANKDDLSWISGPCFSAGDDHIHNESC